MKNLPSTRIILIFMLAIFQITSCKKATLPTLSTSAVSNITAISATSGGVIISNGGTPVIASGVCWSTSTEPTIEDKKITQEITTGSFTSNLTDLEGGTLYYVRAYATNSEGTGYGRAESFTTLGQAPSAITGSATNITVTGATLNSTVNANYLPTTITFEYGPTITYGSTVIPTQSPITGNSNTPINIVITDLNPGTNYHFRIKTVNTRGTIYGSDMTFTTLGQVPTVTTQSAKAITTTGATLYGLVNANDLSTTVTFDYGTTTLYGNILTVTQSPVTGHSSTVISATLSGLNPGTLYHFRIKSVNSLGSTNGSDLTFTTLGQAPTASSLSATNITATSSTLNGIVNANFLSTIVTFEYGTTTSYGNTAPANQSPVTGSINSSVSTNITGLIAGTIYHFRIKTTNSLGTITSNDLTFATSFNGVTGNVSDSDGNIYQTIGIGYQIWMAENLKTTTYNDGTSIPLIINQTSWGTVTTPQYCWYNFNETSFKSTYGALYNWFTVNTGKLCPHGWHVPTDSEWTTLTDYLGGLMTAGNLMKESGTSHWLSPNNGATNGSGFTALPGAVLSGGSFFPIGGYGYWWTSTQYENLVEASYCRDLGYYYNYINRSYINKVSGLSVRCLKDN